VVVGKKEKKKKERKKETTNNKQQTKNNKTTKKQQNNKTKTKQTNKTTHTRVHQLMRAQHTTHTTEPFVWVHASAHVRIHGEVQGLQADIAVGQFRSWTLAKLKVLGGRLQYHDEPTANYQEHQHGAHTRWPRPT
jgi:hypothetical protein